MLGHRGEKRVTRAKPAALLLAILLLVPAWAFGDVGEFVPTIFSSQGDFELSVIHQSDENTAGGRGSRTTDSFASERLLLYLDGYIYHPRFIQFLMKGAGGLFEERYDNNFGGSFSQTAWTNDYEFRTKILPEHPYNLELYTMSTTPYFRQTTAETRVTDIERGALFNYADRPLFLNFSSTSGENKARIYSSEYRTERASGSLLSGPVTNSAAYTHTDASTSLGMQNSTDQSSLDNTIAFRDLSLESRLTQDRLKQNSPFAATLDTDYTTWLEQFNARLPWNFSTTASYNFLKTNMKTEATSATPEQNSITQTKSTNFSVSHKLYDSVRTSYNYNQTVTDTSAGDTKSITNSLIGIYTKKVPTDGRLTVSAEGSRTRMNQESAPLFVGETYNVPLFGTFTLSRGNIDPATIVINVLSDTGALINLVQFANYVVVPTGNTMVISIVSLPPEIIAEGHPARFPYTFRVNYTLLTANVDIEITTIGYGVSLSLFSNFITPYYSLLRTDQRVLSGSIPGGPQEIDTVIIGINIQKAPFGWVTEDRTVNSNVNPSRSLRNTLDYSKRMSDTLNLSAKAEEIRTVYGQGLQGTSGYTEQITNLNLILLKNVPRQKLTASLTAYYSQRRATFNTDLYSATGNLTWKIGLLSIDLGASLNTAQTSGSIGQQRQTSEYYYLTMRRKLF